MKMLVVLLLLHTIVINETVLYVNGNKDYSFELPKEYTRNFQEIKGGYVEGFYVYDLDSVLKYAIFVARVKGKEGIGYNDLLSKEFKIGLLANCMCEIVQEEEVQYNNFKGLRIKTRLLNGKDNYTDAVSTVKNNNFYHIKWISNKTNMLLYEQEFENVLNSMRIFK